MSQALNDLGITVLPITVQYADAQASLPRHHSDPFDRLIVAQALVEKVQSQVLMQGWMLTELHASGEPLLHDDANGTDVLTNGCPDFSPKTGELCEYSGNSPTLIALVKA